MQVQRIKQPTGRISFDLLDDGGLPVPEISGFLRYLESRDYSPHTISAYAYDLLHFSRFLVQEGLETMRSPMRAPGRRSSRHTRPGGRTTTASTITPIVSARMGDTVPYAVLREVLGRTYPEEVLSRALYATQFTRHLDRHGYLKFKHWRFFGENGLAGEEVSVWVYEDTVKVEHQATTLSLYSVRLSPDQH